MRTQESLLNRRSIRKYLKAPVAPDLLKKIMTAATWAPSGGNGQPWRFYVTTGAKRDEFIGAMIGASGPDAPTAEEFNRVTTPTFEEGLRLVWKGSVSEAELKKFEQDSHRHNHFGSIRFFDAPVAIVVAKTHVGGSSLDIGAAVENLLIAAQAEELGTCWLGIPLMYRDTIRKVLDIPENEDLVTCVSLGYPDMGSPINRGERTRLPHDQTVHYLG